MGTAAGVTDNANAAAPSSLETLTPDRWDCRDRPLAFRVPRLPRRLNARADAVSAYGGCRDVLSSLVYPDAYPET